MPTIAEAWLQEGIAEGIAKGKAEGIVEGKEADVLKMIELKMSNSDICKITGFNIKKINELRKKLLK